MDIREFLFTPLKEHKFIGEIIALQPGILAGTEKLKEVALELGLELQWILQEGQHIASGSCICRATGTAWQIARAEEELLGCIGKPSGVATAASEIVSLAGDKVRVVCGAWKKVPREIRADLRKAIATGGAGIRIVDEPFVYLDKNYIRMFGGIIPAVRRAQELQERVIVVQLRGEGKTLAEESREAAYEGAHILMVDTGRIEDLKTVQEVALKEGFRNQIKLAFAGGVNKNNIRDIAIAGADIVDVGRAIIDAPLLDFRLEVICKANER
jgi:nicotinate-nucleotide pyrophosphorylase (carboxylating)